MVRETVNKKEGLSVPRVFVQGKFVKPEFCGEHSPLKSSLTTDLSAINISKSEDK